ncbi:MAG: exodeoxyribonuclease III [bacterium]
METVKIISWNVNGLRAILDKNFYAFTETYRPDILCLQETKIYADVCPKIEGFKEAYYNHCEIKKGYSGTAIFSQISPISVRNLDVDAEHPEGRIIIAEYASFYLINTYVPNSKGDLQRLPYRTQVWDEAMRKLLLKLEQTKPILWCGDLNVAHQPIDLEHPDANHFSAGFTDEERHSFSEHLKAGFVDVFRYFYPEKTKQYTWWSYRMRAREKNVGWRIDYFIASPKLLPHIASCEILLSVMGSDHAPIALELDKSLF